MEDKVGTLVVDSGALIKGAPIRDWSQNVVTVKEILTEVRDLNTRRRLQVLPYDISFREPSQEALQRGECVCLWVWVCERGKEGKTTTDKVLWNDSTPQIIIIRYIARFVGFEKQSPLYCALATKFDNPKLVELFHKTTAEKTALFELNNIKNVLPNLWVHFNKKNSKE